MEKVPYACGYHQEERRLRRYSEKTKSQLSYLLACTVIIQDKRSAHLLQLVSLDLDCPAVGYHQSNLKQNSVLGHLFLLHSC